MYGVLKQLGTSYIFFVYKVKIRKIKLCMTKVGGLKLI